MQKSVDIQAVVEFIRKHEKFVVLGHVAPDGDCIGSQLALTFFLQRLGKTAYAVSMGPFSKNEVKSHAELFAREIDDDWKDYAVFIVDSATFERTGFEPFGVAVMTIDHHASIEENYIPGLLDVGSPSTTLLIQRLIESFNNGLSEQEARWLFLGFATDTGFFRHLRSGSGNHLRRAAVLIDMGASPAEVFAMLEGGYRLTDRQYLGSLLASAEGHEDDRIVTVVDHGQVKGAKEMQLPSRDTDTLYRLLLSAENTEVVAIFKVDDEQITVGLRSKNYVNVGEIAQKLGGGGHARASGFITNDISLPDLQKKIINMINIKLE
ncbi:bifunctional oligoribonuclease/PAP phosphatase NrnA [Entomospira entomophila]|uniref:Bifunctional oligoribonuclease/PAP phosphatase NrnA n=1 Tax=Entomospira entomophila TaxID=2719988 RepID=A0A968GCJ6_9SPIO|nr:bifunctional oligoribonuclease/PAP phosphatase NrnA [Entomospira entomophilus]NIZ39964.1 bifunctional oligoribonuclease/PAP phosphatase NrnA [Entomospira entomophilus]WDI35525.1 bifunctional oligoribonuclease/PAP phosphatase NrnA [Entomospira entomophilus]